MLLRAILPMSLLPIRIAGLPVRIALFAQDDAAHIIIIIIIEITHSEGSPDSISHAGWQGVVTAGFTWDDRLRGNPPSGVVVPMPSNPCHGRA